MQAERLRRQRRAAAGRRLRTVFDCISWKLVQLGNKSLGDPVKALLIPGAQRGLLVERGPRQDRS
jgi:hypothetical protein